MSKECELTTWEDALDAIWEEILKPIMIARHRKYGPSNISEFGELGCLVRASDKIQRIKRSLLHAGPADGSDSLDDSTDDAWTDLANYAVIRHMLARGWWDFPARYLNEP